MPVVVFSSETKLAKMEATGLPSSTVPGRGKFGGDTIRQQILTNRRTRRKWLPNVQKKRMFSEQLDSMVQLRLTTGAMRCSASPHQCFAAFEKAAQTYVFSSLPAAIQKH